MARQKAVETPPLPAEAPATPISPKVVIAGVAAFLAPTLLIMADYLLGEGRGLLAGWHPLLQIAAFSLLTTASVVLSAYVKRDAIREFGAQVLASRRGNP